MRYPFVPAHQGSRFVVPFARLETMMKRRRIDLVWPCHCEQVAYLAGDGCLNALAGVWARGGDLVARHRGEEFVVLLPNTGGPDALETALQIQREV